MLLKSVVSLAKMDGFRAKFEFVKPIRELFMPVNRNEDRVILNKHDFQQIQNAVWRIRPYQVHEIQQEFVRLNKEMTRDQLIQLCEDAVRVKSVAIFSDFFTDVLFINSDGTRNQKMEQNILKCALKSSFECFHFLLSMGLELKMDNATIFRTLISSKSPENLKYFCDQRDFGFEDMVVHGFLFNIFRRGVEMNIKLLLEYDAVRKQINELIDFKSDNWSGVLNQYAPLHCCLLSLNHTVWTGPRDKQLKLRCVEMIVKAGADINLCSIMEKQSVAPILMAAKHRHEDLVWYFLQHGVDLHTDPKLLDKVIEELQYEYLQNLKESQERRPQKSYGHQIRTPDITVQLKCLERLYQLKEVPYARDSPAHISLYLTAAPSNDKTFLTLLDQAIENGLSFKMSHLPLLVKVMESFSYDVTLIKKLLNIGCNVHLHGGQQGKTPLILAAQNLKKDVVCLLLEYGADVNAKTAWRNVGCSCLAHYYNRSENSVTRTEDRLEILDILIEAGLDYKNPEIGLFSAAFQSKTYDKKCIWYLINKGLDVNNVGSFGECQNILHLAAEWVYDEEFLTELLTTGVDMEQMGDGFTPLTLAAMMRNPCLTKVLVDNGCDINRRCADGETALSIAISRSYTEPLVRILLEGGADIENYMHDSDLASLLEYNQIFFYLILKHGGDMYLNHRDSKGFRLIQRLLKPDCEFSGDGVPDEALLHRLIAYNCSVDDLQIPMDEEDFFGYSYHTEYYDPGLFCDSKFTSKFQRIFYLSGAPKEMLRHLPQFYDDDCCYSDDDDDNEDGEKDGESSVFNLEKMCFEQSLKSLCRRIVRQSMGLGIKRKLEKSFLPRSIQSFILLKDEIPEEYFEIPEEKIVEKLS